MRKRSGDYRIAIPTFKRPTTAAEHTIPVLTRGGVDPGRITAFLHDHDPAKDETRAACAALGVRSVTTTARGLRAQRQAIISSHPDGTPLVQVDDDLKRVGEARIGQKKLQTVTDVDGLFRMMFMETSARDAWVWGLAPVGNPFYMRPSHISEGLRFCVSTLIGCYTRPGHPVHISTVETKDDYELSLRAWWYDGAVVRYDGAHAEADHYSTPGGITDARTAELEEQSVKTLETAWPGLVKRNLKRKSGYPEITLTARPRTRGHNVTVPPPGVNAGS
jgi:hypothetical protein